MRLVYCVALMMGLCLAAGAQDFRPGYVVPHGGDTLRGFIEYTSADLHARQCRFRSQRDGTTQVYLPPDLAAFGITNSRRFISRELTNEGQTRLVFAQLLENGRAKLLLYSDIYWVEKDSAYRLPPPTSKMVDTKEGPMIRHGLAYIGMLNYLFADCPVNTGSAQYEARFLSKIVRKYNVCKGQSDVTAIETKPWTRVNFQAFAGIQHSSMMMTSNEKATSISPTGGLGIELSSPRLYDKVYFVVEACYYTFLFQSYTEYQGPDYIIRTDNIYKSQAVKFPIGVRLNLNEESKTLYFKMGASFTALINPSSSLSTEYEQSGIVTSNYITDQTLTAAQSIGIWGGVGYVKALGPIKAFGEFRAETGKLSNLTLLVGLRF